MADRDYIDRIFVGDCRERLRELPDASVDLIVTSPLVCHLSTPLMRIGDAALVPMPVRYPAVPTVEHRPRRIVLVTHAE